MGKTVILMVVIPIFICSFVPLVVGLQELKKIPFSGVISYSSVGWLHTEGRNVVDSNGNIVTLYGANFMGYEYGVWNDVPDMHSESDYRKMSEWGFNVVRLPIAWSYIEPSPGFYDDSYFTNHVDKDIAWAKKYGIYIILDMHQIRWSPYFTWFGSKGIGFPAWACSGYSDDDIGEGQAVDDFWLGKAPNGTLASPMNPSLQDRYINMWKYVATRYTSESTIVAYDLFNEPPWGGFFNGGMSVLTVSQTTEALFSFYEKLIYEIRKADPNHIIMYEPLGGWDVKHPKVRQLMQPNLIFTFHNYYYADNYDDIGADISNLEDFFLEKFWNQPSNNPIRNWDQPIFMGEGGACYNSAYGDLWTRDILMIYDKYQLGSAWWSYYKEDAYARGLCNSDGLERTIIVQYLDRTHPISSSIALSSYMFNATAKYFSTSITTASAFNVSINIYVPLRHYPDGFTVLCSGSLWDKYWNNSTRTLAIWIVVNGSVTLSIS